MTTQPELYLTEEEEKEALRSHGWLQHPVSLPDWASPFFHGYVRRRGVRDSVVIGMVRNLGFANRTEEYLDQWTSSWGDGWGMLALGDDGSERWTRQALIASPALDILVLTRSGFSHEPPPPPISQSTWPGMAHIGSLEAERAGHNESTHVVREELLRAALLWVSVVEREARFYTIVDLDEIVSAPCRSGPPQPVIPSADAMRGTVVERAVVVVKEWDTSRSIRLRVNGKDESSMSINHEGYGQEVRVRVSTQDAEAMRTHHAMPRFDCEALDLVSGSTTHCLRFFSAMSSEGATKTYPDQDGLPSLHDDAVRVSPWTCVLLHLGFVNDDNTLAKGAHYEALSIDRGNKHFRGGASLQVMKSWNKTAIAPSQWIDGPASSLIAFHGTLFLPRIHRLVNWIASTLDGRVENAPSPRTESAIFLSSIDWPSVHRVLRRRDRGGLLALPKTKWFSYISGHHNHPFHTELASEQ